MKIDENNLKGKLGRAYKPDERDKGFPMKSFLPKTTPGITYKYWWSNGYWGDQGYEPECVGYSWTHWLADGPITQKDSRKQTGSFPINPSFVYDEAQKVDVWAGENYDGTSVRAGAKVLKAQGFLSSYYWAWDLQTTINALLTVGPVVVGTTWLSDMFYPNNKGIITATGSVAGGHAYLLDGVNVEKKMFRIKNSWGREWGKNGFAYISFDDMEKLINDYGEVCLATEIDKQV